MALLCEEKLPECYLSQLETRFQRVSAYVLHHNKHHLVKEQTMKIIMITIIII